MGVVVGKSKKSSRTVTVKTVTQHVASMSPTHGATSGATDVPATFYEKTEWDHDLGQHLVVLIHKSNSVGRRAERKGKGKEEGKEEG